MIYYFVFVSVLFFCLFAFSKASPTAYGGSRVAVESELQLPAYTTATVTRDPRQVCDLHSTAHANAGSKPHLQPIPQLTAMPGPEPTERGQGSNPSPHGG